MSLSPIRHRCGPLVLLGALFLPLLPLLPLAAQEGGTVSLQFLSFPKDIDPKPVKLHVGEGETIEVEIPSNELSPVYKVPRMATWTVGEPATDDDGQPVFKSYGAAKALESSHQLILLVRKGKENSDGFNLIPVDNRITKFGGGKFLFMNASKTNIYGVVGTEKFGIEPGKTTIVEPKPDSKNERICHASLYYQKDGKAKNFFSTKWPLHEDARGLIFVYNDAQTSRLRLHSIHDFFAD